MSGRRVVITGVASQWGAELARRLERDPSIEYLAGIDDAPPAVELERTDFIEADIRSPLLSRLLPGTGAETIVHCGIRWFPEPGKPSRVLHDVNVIGTLQLLAACERTETLRSLVVRGSAAIYGCEGPAPCFFTEEMARRLPLRTRFQRDASELEAYIDNFARRHAEIVCCILRYQPEIGPGLDSPLVRYLSLPVVASAPAPCTATGFGCFATGAESTTAAFARTSDTSPDSTRSVRCATSPRPPAPAASGHRFTPVTWQAAWPGSVGERPARNRVDAAAERRVRRRLPAPHASRDRGRARSADRGAARRDRASEDGPPRARPPLPSTPGRVLRGRVGLRRGVRGGGVPAVRVPLRRLVEGRGRRRSKRAVARTRPARLQPRGVAVPVRRLDDPGGDHEGAPPAALGTVPGARLGVRAAVHLDLHEAGGRRSREPPQRGAPSRPERAGDGLSRGGQGHRQAVLGPLPPAALRPGRVRRGGAQDRGADRSGRRSRLRGDLPEARRCEAARPADRRPVRSGHTDVPVARSAGADPAALEVADRLLRPDRPLGARSRRRR